MQLIFTKSDSPVSRIIRNTTGECVSHVAIANAGFVIHSNFLGARIDTAEDFLKHSKIVHFIEMPYSKELLESALLKVGSHAKYDFGGMLYLWLRAYLPFLPKKNLWQSSGLYLCTEFVTEVLDREQDSMITPYQLYLKLKERYSNV